MVSIKDRKGFLFTISTVILIIPLIYLVSFYSGASETQMDNTLNKMRCDELHYYIEDVKRDMGRSVVIFGRRAATNVIDDVVQSGVPMRGYSFNCTSMCNVDCDKFIYPENGSEAAIAELVVCGTLHGKNISNMLNNTLPGWIGRIEEEGRLMGFDANITPYEIKVIPKDAWHFAIIIYNKVKVYDREGICFYSENIINSTSNTSVIGLEDPLHLLENKKRKYILNCEDDQVLARTKAGCGVNGSGAGDGLAVLYSLDISNLNAYRNYCTGVSNSSPSGKEIEEQVFVLNHGMMGLCGGGGMCECFNASSLHSFGAFISFRNLTAAEIANCQITIPWIVGTGDLDNVNPINHGGNPDPECFEGGFIESGDCLSVLNACGEHYVIFGYGSMDINATSCYYVSDIEEYHNPQCPSVNYSNGPCFFDRLDGNLNLSEKYVNQANETFGTSLIGLESFVDIYTLYAMEQSGYDVEVSPNSTWVDYLYWQNVSGCDVVGYCKIGNYSFNMDCSHAHKYQMDTDCEQVIGCPVCADGFCSPLEDCVSCPQDCVCLGCPVFINLSTCKSCVGLNCNVSFALTVLDGTGYLLNLSVNPRINITYDGAIVLPTPVMVPVVGETGRYIHFEVNRDINKFIGGNISIKESGCPLVDDAIAYGNISSIACNY